MADNNDNPPVASDENAERQFSIQRVYLKDVSFESPRVPKVFTLTNFSPEIGIQLNTESTALGEDHFEVVLTVTVTAKQDDENVYLVEVGQAGLFQIAGFPEQEIAQMAGSFCPNILFPFAREAISDLAVKGGFPQMLLAPVNFDALYSQHMEQLQQQEPASGDAH